MNYSMIRRVLGWILLFESVFLLVPAITGLCFQEEREVTAICITIGICAVVGGLCVLRKPKSDAIYAKEGYVIVALSWVVMSLFGALPFWISGAIPSYVDALFETVSGFTTTGATIIPTAEAVDTFPKCLHMWRCFTHWIGGMGVLVFIMVFLRLSGGGHNMNLLKAESPGPTVGKLMPRMRTTTRILYLIYTGLTVLQFIFLLFGDMTVFEALCTAFGTAGTGGFGVRGDGFASFSTYSQVVVTIFMLLFSINFTSYYLILCGKFKESLNAEVRTFLIIVAVAICSITLNVYFTASELYQFTFGETLKHAAFSVASIISTTGFATANFDLWPAFSKTILVMLMFIGACAGSTGGGMKVSRMMILFKGTSHEMKRMLHPKQVKKITMDGRVVEHEVVRGVNTFVIAYVAIYIVSLLIVSFDCSGLVTNFTAVAATINNIGPGLELVGPNGNFAFYSWWSKLVFIFDMLAGRLEIFPMLLLFAPATWRK